MRGSTAMIEKERQSELIRKFVVSQEMPDDEIADLSLDELTYIYFNTEIVHKSPVRLQFCRAYLYLLPGYLPEYPSIHLP